MLLPLRWGALSMGELMLPVRALSILWIALALLSAPLLVAPAGAASSGERVSFVRDAGLADVHRSARATGCSTTMPRQVRQCRKLARHVFGHRCRQYPEDRTNENTLRSLREAHLNGVGCESDTPRIASDDGTPSAGRSVIFHDLNQLTRVTSAESRTLAGVPDDATIAEVTLRQFRLLRTKGGEPLPTLRQFIRFAARHQVPAMIELKWTPADPAQVAALVRQFGGQRFVSFYQEPQPADGPHPCDLNGSQAFIAEGLRVGVKQLDACPMRLSDLAAAGYSFIAADGDKITRARVRRAHALGLSIGNQNSGRATDWVHLVRTRADFAIAPRPGAMKRWLMR
jgi:hypothetical protein